jgi:uncharacterized membrane protein
MGTLTVWKFDSPDGAEKALELLQTMQKQSLITVNDAATVYWPVGARTSRPGRRRCS